MILIAMLSFEEIELPLFQVDVPILEIININDALQGEIHYNKTNWKI